MKRLGLALALWASLSCAAMAQIGGLMFPGPGVPRASGGGGFSLTFGQLASSLATTTTVNYGTLTYGSGCSSVIVAISTFAPGGPAVSSVSVNGTAASAVVTSTAGNANVLAAIWQANGVSGSSGSVSVTYSVAPSDSSAVAVYCLVTTTTAASATNTGGTANGTTTGSVPITVPSGGGALVVTNSYGGGGSITLGFTNATSDGTFNSSASGKSATLNVGHTTSTGSINVVGTTNVNTVINLAVAAWSP